MKQPGKGSSSILHGKDEVEETETLTPTGYLIVGSEVMTPLTDTMCLIYYNSGKEVPSIQIFQISAKTIAPVTDKRSFE